MISPETPHGAQVVCIRNGPVGNLCGDIPLPSIGGYYTVDYVSPTGITEVTPLPDHAVYLVELPPHYVVHGGITHHIGYGLEWFRPIDRWVDKMLRDAVDNPCVEVLYREYVAQLLEEASK